jgi:mannose-1-phosphate guanylyltransferase
VRRFWEKAELSLARRLRKAGCLWNSFVMVAPVPTFLSMILDTVPEFYHAFGDLPTVRETAGEADTARALYRSLPTVDFSRQILGARPSRLAVLPVRGLAWSDLGDPRRVEETRTRVAVGCPSASRSFLVDDGLRHPAAVSQ